MWVMLIELVGGLFPSDTPSYIDISGFDVYNDLALYVKELSELR
jgi:hypothetical protein